ncbi:MAG: hypothetical protein LBR27_07575 [Bifidobacteriaceae bacterium]|jgi:hypothetical protein|nr:hypothetical protein [Bifidobacteriaceae bacterium]
MTIAGAIMVVVGLLAFFLGGYIQRNSKIPFSLDLDPEVTYSVAVLPGTYELYDRIRAGADASCVILDTDGVEVPFKRPSGGFGMGEPWPGWATEFKVEEATVIDVTCTGAEGGEFRLYQHARFSTLTGLVLGSGGQACGSGLFIAGVVLFIIGRRRR